MGLPKPDLMQTNPKAGDFVKGKKAFLENFGAGSGQNAGYVAQDVPPENKSVLWIDTSDDSVDVDLAALPTWTGGAY